ncbi:Plasmodium exported protein, unknown function [Plasmodium knowlesi strain H]|uniref:Plasmodium RESA N-terminal domain-containing protein n=3 Tax=Plasmodium knowlesi TaxID=5850 RepID=A0A5K1UMS9_PLAKH|nr:Plasmodium exported protein (PHIST), unknown function [Plasmodium knowlesi strain H]OTN67942.1 Uncharacterized protein PKNOH_S04360900 [Plasmodium knowlesi]CAA9986969.1 Plasmodium exported protein (PHIST), unknown function [Plasmodium knowlesi strain H]SBO26591.1 Plasmodium exported protein, unknown function [Plasmodium knowlesi strain H]SBO28175.1 Plasmodium exported protein, unknown function [Plasmodium knowlesi strain H]VVS76443.1 Plasmodium exported protein (PHIST), unknown function [Pl|eukprot:XP_002258214.1 hypothetical protein, conserved in Plasmodium species [Plasmodium knowlesi strain H]
MARMSTWKKFPLSLGFTTLLFFVWIGILSIHKYKYEGRTLDKLLTGCYPRSLSSASSSNYDGAPIQVNQTYYENNNHLFYTDKYKEFLSTLNDIELEDRVLTGEEINNLMQSLGLFISKKKAKLVFFHYNNYMKKLFNDAMDRLWAEFFTAAMRRGIPQDYQLFFWKKCDDEITDYFIARDEFFLDEFQSFLPKGNVKVTAKLFSFLGNYYNSWMEDLGRYELKWSGILNDSVNKYTPRW